MYNIHYGDVLIKYGDILDIEKDEVPFIKEGKESKKNSFLQDGDIVIADTAEDETVGKAVEIYNTQGEQIEAGLHTIPCHPICEYAPMYLGYYINSPYFHSQLFALMQGVKVLSISKGNIAKTTITAPNTLDEQRKISSVLRLIDIKIQKQRQLVETLAKFRRGLNRRLLSKISQHHNYELGSVCSIIGGGTPDTLHAGYWNGSIEWFTPSEIGKSKYVVSSNRKISKEGLSNSSAKLLPSETVLLTTRATLGEMSITKVECSTNQGFQSLIADRHKVLPEYIYYLQILIKPWCEKYSSGNTFREISKSALAKCIVPIPELKVQAKIVHILSSVDALIETQEKTEHFLTQLKKGLMQQLFI